MELAFLKWTDPRVASAWKSMETGHLSPFLHHAYLDYVYRFTRRVKPLYRPRVACVLDGDEIVMMAALRGSFGGRSWKMLGDVQGCGCTDALWKPSLGAGEREALSAFFFRNLPEKLSLHRIQADSPLLRSLPQERLESRQEQPCVRIDIPAGDADALLKSLRASVRQNVRTAYNRMRRDGMLYRLEIFDADHPVSKEVWRQIMTLYFDRILSRYKQKKAKSWVYRIVKHRHYFRIKHDTLSLRSLPNTFHAVLWNGERIMAFMSGLTTRDGRSVAVPRLAIDAAYSFYSPGYVLLSEVIRHLADHPTLHEIDLSRGEERYKLDMGGQPYPTFDVEIRPLEA